MQVVDMHCDTISVLWERELGGTAGSLRRNDLHVDLEKMKKGDYLLQNFALFVYLGSGRDPLESARSMLRIYERELEANQDLIAGVLRYEDIEKNRKEGKLSALLTIEEGGACKGNLDNLRMFYEAGVRMMTLTWNYANELGHPNIARARDPEAEEGNSYQKLFLPDTERGLTETGIAFVQEMERLGMIIDVSHLSDAGFYDVLKNTRRPFAASHSNARAVCPCVRNMTDEMIRALAERGGVMGLNFCADFLETKPEGESNPGTIEAIVRHADHILRVGGTECLGLGTDFDGIDTHGELPDAASMPLLDAALKKAGWSASVREKIFNGNVLRLYRDVLQ